MLLIRAADRPFVPAGHEDPQDPGVVKRVLATREELQPGWVQMVNWARLKSGRRFAPHYHEEMQEIFVILNGQLELDCDGQRVILEAGDAVRIEAREVHTMVNHGSAEVDYLAIGIVGNEGGRTVVVDSPNPS